MTNSRWVLRGYDRSTEREAEAVYLDDASDEDVRRILSLAPDEELYGCFPVPDSAADQVESWAKQRLDRSRNDYFIESEAAD